MKTIALKTLIIAFLLFISLAGVDKTLAQMTPPDAQTLFNLGRAYSGSSRYTEAIEAFKQSIAQKPDDAYNHAALGTFFLKIGDKEKALEEYKILKTLNTEFAEKLLKMIGE